MKLIIGLGNPGKKFEKTRHNCGFIVLDKIVIDKGLNWRFDKGSNAEIAKGGDRIFAKPQTFMNDSGFSVAKLVGFYKIDLDNLIVVHDDVDLPFGEFRYRKGSGTAGHHGVESIFEKLGSLDFWRFRVGVDRPQGSAFDVKEYVLEKFSDEQVLVVQGRSEELLSHLW